jgi:acyl carrier protein phosphodiesterase
VGGLNFPAHAYVARVAVGDDEAVLFGAMLPDLANMAGRRFELVLPDDVEAGRQLHHRADERFHEHPAFRSGVGRLRTSLRADGLATGPSRAGAHLGYELVLDTCLPWDDGLAGALSGALAYGAVLASALPGEAKARWTTLLERLASVAWAGLTETSDDELAGRVDGILSRRPRLALPPGRQATVARALSGARPGIERDSGAVFAAVVAVL